MLQVLVSDPDWDLRERSLTSNEKPWGAPTVTLSSREVSIWRIPGQNPLVTGENPPLEQGPNTSSYFLKHQGRAHLRRKNIFSCEMALKFHVAEHVYSISSPAVVGGNFAGDAHQTPLLPHFMENLSISGQWWSLVLPINLSIRLLEIGQDYVLVQYLSMNPFMQILRKRV